MRYIKISQKVDFSLLWGLVGGGEAGQLEASRCHLPHPEVANFQLQNESITDHYFHLTTNHTLKWPFFNSQTNQSYRHHKISIDTNKYHPEVANL